MVTDEAAKLGNPAAAAAAAATAALSRALPGPMDITSWKLPKWQPAPPDDDDDIEPFFFFDFDDSFLLRV